jgi:TRAP-type C4-dicarboxylate transport system permease small subunit
MVDSANDQLNIFQRMIHLLTRCSLYIGMGWVMVMMGLTTVDVAGRIFFSKPLPGGIELTEIMLAVFGLLGLAYTHQSGSNIRVTMLVNALPKRFAAGLDVVTHCLCIGVIALLATQGWAMGLEEMASGTTTDLLKVPLFPIYFLLALASIFIGLEMLLMLISALKLVLTGNSRSIY